MAKESPDIWMPLYIGDYLGKTMHLSATEHGCYLLLLMAYWKNGGPISSSDKKLAAICRVPLSEFSAIRSALEEYFTEENGLWINPRADREILKWGQMKDDRGYGAALSNFKKFGTPIPEKYAGRYAERDAGHNADTPLSVTPSPSPSPSSLPSPSTQSLGEKKPSQETINAIFDAYPSHRTIKNETVPVSKTLNDYNLISQTLKQKPDYPLLESVKLYAQSTKAPKDLRHFLAALPDMAALRSATKPVSGGVKIQWADEQ